MFVFCTSNIFAGSPDSHAFPHRTSPYFLGIDRIVAATAQGKLMMLQIDPLSPTATAAGGEAFEGTVETGKFTWKLRFTQ